MSADPVTANVSRAGELAVIAAVNALSAEKVMPESFRPVILLPPGTEEHTLRELIDQMCRACKAQGLVIEGGHTEVTGAVVRPVVIGACTGTPMEGPAGRHNVHKAKDPQGRPDEEAADRIRIKAPGEIVMTKWAGMEGSCILAREREEELRKVFPETILMRMRGLSEHLSVKEEAVICAEQGADHLTDLSEGGICAALWRLSVKAKRGFRIAVTDDADGLIGKLEGSGIPAARIGALTDDRDKILINGGEIRYLDLPQPDELLKIMEDSR